MTRMRRGALDWQVFQEFVKMNGASTRKSYLLSMTRMRRGAQTELITDAKNLAKTCRTSVIVVK